MHRRLILINCLVMLNAIVLNATEKSVEPRQMAANQTEPFDENQTRSSAYLGICYSERPETFYLFTADYYLQIEDDLIEKRFLVNQTYSTKWYALDSEAENLKMVRTIQTIGDECYLTMQIGNANQTFLFDNQPKLIQMKHRFSLSIRDCFQKCTGQILQIKNHLFCFLENKYYHLFTLGSVKSDSQTVLHNTSDLLPIEGEELKFIFKYRDHQYVFMTQGKMFVVNNVSVESNSPILPNPVKLGNCLFNDCKTGKVDFQERKKPKIQRLITQKVVVLILLAVLTLILIIFLSVKNAKKRKKATEKVRIRGEQALTEQARAEQARANQEAFVKVKEMFQKKIGKASLKRVMEISEGEKQIAKVITNKKMLKVDLVARRRPVKKMAAGSKTMRQMKTARSKARSMLKALKTDTAAKEPKQMMRIVNEIEILKVENKMEVKSVRTQILESGTHPEAFNDYLKANTTVGAGSKIVSGQPKQIKVDLKQSVQLKEQPTGLSQIKVKSSEVLYKITQIHPESNQTLDSNFSQMFK